MPRLIQEDYVGSPWRMMVACILLNRTTVRQVRPVLAALFKKYPGATALAEADLSELTSMLRPLGLQRRRAAILIDFSRAYPARRTSRPEGLPGIGPYALDSWDIFVAKSQPPNPPADAKLRARLRELCKEVRRVS